MNTLLHRDGDESPDSIAEASQREFTLGPTVILGIFFALAVLCAVFFGFGYTMGRKTNVTAAMAAPNGAPVSTNFSGFKPAAGNALSGAEPKPASSPVAPAPYTPSAAAQPAKADNSLGAAAEDAKLSARLAATASAIPAGGATMVQIAAVSHQEDADLLMTTLKRRGYAVALHAEPQDKLLHVQIGPFVTHKDADAMRQRLLADGFNAIVKDPAK